MPTLSFVSVVLVSAALLPAQQPAERAFATPKEAVQALIDAAGQNDTAALLKLFGSQGKDLVESGDPADDKTARADFVRRANEKLDIEMDPSKSRATVIAGNDKWPLPVPLVKTKSGEWHFDSARGRTEILARRIGRNELIAIDVCRAYVEAQMDYAQRNDDKAHMLHYAQKLASVAPKSWVDGAPYHGYYFRILTAQGPDATGGERNYIVKGEMIGGFALIAYPAQYGVSGIKTLIVNNSGVVYERDLGPTTASQAHLTTRYNPDKKWQPVSGE
jgi:hypothetical protein